MNIAHNVTELVGGTPLVKLNPRHRRSQRHGRRQSWVHRPGHSVAGIDIAVAMLDAAIAAGKIGPVPWCWNRPRAIPASAWRWSAPRARYQRPRHAGNDEPQALLLLKAYGALLILTPGPEGMGGAIAKAGNWPRNRKYSSRNSSSG